MQIFSFFQNALNPIKITVEIHTRFQIPSFQILGLPAPEIQEARERIIAAFNSSDLEFPKKKVIINLAPSSFKKSGTGHDLAIAIQILCSSLDLEFEGDLYAWGELGLNGEVKACGKIALLIELLLEEDPGVRSLILSSDDLRQFEKLIHWRKSKRLPNPKKIKIFEVSQFKDFQDQMKSGGTQIESLNEAAMKTQPYLGPALLSLSPTLERVLKIALIGGHHTLLLGPKGVGKSQALQWFEELAPESHPLQTWKRILHEESRDLEIDFRTPIRRVHSQIKPPHLTGSWGPKGFRAGELTLAHGGLLIADEFMEWPRDAKECLREPLQSKKLILTRVHGQVQFDCDLQMIGTGNLCPCGGLPPQFFALLEVIPSKKAKCRCRPHEVTDYFQKLSGPIADRIDLICIYSSAAEVSNQIPEKNKIKEEISRARELALKSFGNYPGTLSVHQLESCVSKNPEIAFLLKSQTSLRSRHKILRIAHSIQALDASTSLKKEHVFEAMSYKSADQLFQN